MLGYSYPGELFPTLIVVINYIAFHLGPGNTHILTLSYLIYIYTFTYINYIYSIIQIYIYLLYIYIHVQFSIFVYTPYKYR